MSDSTRIIDQTTDSSLVDGDYVIVDNQNEGTRKYNLGKELTEIKEDLSDLQEEIEGGGSGLTADLKAALDQLAQKVAYIDDDGADYYDALHNALYPPASLSSISCVYTQSGTVYDTDTLDSLKSDLVVTAHYSNGTTQTVTSYTLSGTLTQGTSTITVTYGGKTTTFNVTVTHASDPSEEWTDGVPYTYTLVSGEYVDAQGVIQTYSTWSRTPYMPCKGASSFTIVTSGSLGSTGYYSHFYDENKNPIGEQFSFHGQGTTKTIDVQTGGCYFILSQSNTIMQAFTSITPTA